MTTAAKVEGKTKERGSEKRSISILYNGDERDFRYRPGQKVGELLADAIAAFGVVANPHVLALFGSSGAELNDASTLRAAGVEAGAELVMRPSAVKGG